MKGHSEPMIGGDEGNVGERASGEMTPGMRGGQEQGVKKRQSKEEGATTTKKARRPGGMTIREGQAMGEGDSARLGIAAAREPSEKSKRKLAAKEGDGQKKPRRRKTVEGTTGGERAVGRQYDEAAAFWLEYERNDDGEIMENELPIQLLIDPRRVCDIPPWERYYNHRSLTLDGVEDIKGAMVRQFHEEKGKIWTKNSLVLAPIYKPVTHKPERAERVHKDVFKPEDKDKYFYYPVNGQHTVAAVKELADKAISELWKMHSWPARVVWFSDEDFEGYLQVSLTENTRHKMFEQRAQKAAFEEMQKSPNGDHWTMARKATTLVDKEHVAAIGNALRQWMPLVTTGDDVFRKGMEFYDKWAERKLLGGDGKTPLSKAGKYMPDKSPGFQAILETGSKGAAGETKMGWLVQVPPPPTKKKTQADGKFVVVMKELDMFYWQCVANMTDVEKLSILDDILALKGVFGLTTQVWVELRKHFQGAVEYVNTCKRTFSYGKESLDETKRMYDDDRFPKSFEKSVRSILRRTEEEVQDTIKVSGDVRHIKWHKLNRVTSLIPFGCPPSRAHSRLTEIREIVRHHVCNLYVLDLFDPTLLSDWHEDDFASLQGVLQTLSPRHWALVGFFPSRWELCLLKGMTNLSVHHVRTGKWVRHAQRKAIVRECNMLVEEYDRLYVICNGENLADNTVAVFPASSPSKPPRANAPSPAKPTAAARSKAACSSYPSGQAVACFDVADEDKFPCSQWEDDGMTSVRGATYRNKERNPTHLIGLLENFCRVGQTVFFFGKADTSVVWELLRSGRNVVALEDTANMIDYLCEFVKTRVGDPRHQCSFVQTTGERNWDPKRDMYWKLSEKKRTEVWEFLFQQGPPAHTDPEYNRRINLVFGVLNGYHNAPREFVSNFLKRLEHVFFLMAEPLTLENYKAQFNEEDPFDAEDMEEMSDSETFDFESMHFPGRLHRKHHRFTPEDVWGHNVVWHPRKFQPAVKTRKWVMAMKEADGEWSGMNRLGAGPFKKRAREALVEHLRVMNPDSSLSVVNAYAGQKLDELYANKMLEFRASFYALETAPSRGIDWRMLQPSSGGQHPGGGGGGDEGYGGRDRGDDLRSHGGGEGGDDSRSAEKGSDREGVGGKGVGWKGSGGKGSGGRGSGGKGSGGKGSGGKRRASGSRDSRETDSHCVGSRDSDMRDEAALKSYQLRVDSHLSARTLFPDVEESPSHRAQPTSPVHNTLLLPLLEEGKRLQHTTASPERQNHSLAGTASSLCLEAGMPALRRSESTTVSSLSSGDLRKLRIDLEFPTRAKCWRGPLKECWRPGIASMNVMLRGVYTSTLRPRAQQLLGKRSSDRECMLYSGKEETQHWQSRGVLETGASENECQALEGASVDSESKSTSAPGEEELSQEAHALQREEETQYWPAPEVLKGLDAGVLVTGTSEEVLHNRSVVATTQDGDVKGGQWTFEEGNDRGEEGRS
ncbi:hypothetical protein CBR_g52118 [Chara braunii]|uniref:Uncharacterized protein n=1 Tax=Chara braunii TaxID=69332 RepID=A0A388M9P4_CHABU|nr:hypothetical protein CBR_g52118 [Chara braunii]|eukprot:GBG91235.1 hypothetical protein CBR_g52118 [Chara braunii]